MNKAIFMIGIIVSILVVPVRADTLTVGCRIAEDNGKPDIWFSDMTGGTFNQNDYAETGTLAVTATVSGNGNTSKFAKQVSYKKVGNRLEIRNTWVTLAVTMDEFKEHFGLFPELSCTSP